MRRSEFDPLQLYVCDCTRSPSGSATSVPTYKCTRFKDYLGFNICDRFFRASLTPYLLTSVQVSLKINDLGHGGSRAGGMG